MREMLGFIAYSIWVDFLVGLTAGGTILMIINKSSKQTIRLFFYEKENRKQLYYAPVFP
jgi:hypothetical protein